MTHIEDHPKFDAVLDEITWYGNRTKKQLIISIYGDGDDRTKEELRKLSRGVLVALAVNLAMGGNPFNVNES